MIQYLRDMYNGFYSSQCNLHPVPDSVHTSGIFTLHNLSQGQRVCHLDDYENISKIHDAGVHTFMKVNPNDTDSVREFIDIYNQTPSNLIVDGDYMVARGFIQKDAELTRSYGIYYWIYELVLNQVVTMMPEFNRYEDKLAITLRDLHNLSVVMGGAFQAAFDLYQTDSTAQDFFQNSGVGIVGINVHDYVHSLFPLVPQECDGM